MASNLHALRILLCVVCYITTSLQTILIPEPNGPNAVAHTTALFVDNSRIDPYDPTGGKRSLVISLYYPIDKPSCLETCSIPYMPNRTALFTNTYTSQNFGFSNATFEQFQLQVCCKVKDGANANIDRYQIILFSPGLTGSRLMYGAYLQKLASAGFVVAGIDHTYETLVEFPDGSVREPKNVSYWELENPTSGKLDALLETRVADGRFVLDQLGNDEVVKKMIPGAGAAFANRLACFYGHSFGGATALRALMKDERIVGAMNMDGTQYGNITDVYAPALLFGRAEPSSHNATDDKSWKEMWGHMQGWRRQLGLRNSGHLTFSDAPLLAKLAGWPINDKAKESIGTLDGARAFEVVTTYVQAFIEVAMRASGRLFDGPEEAYPEIVLEK